MTGSEDSQWSEILPEFRTDEYWTLEVLVLRAKLVT